MVLKFNVLSRISVWTLEDLTCGPERPEEGTLRQLTKTSEMDCSVTGYIRWAVPNADHSTCFCKSRKVRILCLFISFTLCMLDIFSYFLSSADFFQNSLFQKILSRTLLGCQTAWIQIRTDVSSVQIWIQTDCKCYQQTTKVAASRRRGNLVVVDRPSVWTVELTVTRSAFIAFTGDFCRLLIIFGNSLDPNQARQNVGPDLDKTCLTLWWYL